jgi:hypothetical protein
VAPINGYYGNLASGWAKPHLVDRRSPSSPYWKNGEPSNTPGFVWANDSKFQLISAGLDDNYGAGYFLTIPSGATAPQLNLNVRQYPVFPLGLNYGGADALFGDDDNITNFSEGSALQDLKP